jgi:hypothetical protein
MRLQYWRFQYNVCAFKIGISSIHFVDCPKRVTWVDFMLDRACWTLNAAHTDVAMSTPNAFAAMRYAR